MSLRKIAAGAYGYNIELEFHDVDTSAAEDLSAYTTAQSIELRAPDESVNALSGSFVGDGSDGKVEATVTEGAIPASWRQKKCAARIWVESATAAHYSEWEEFEPV